MPRSRKRKAPGGERTEGAVPPPPAREKTASKEKEEKLPARQKDGVKKKKNPAQKGEKEEKPASISSNNAPAKPQQPRSDATQPPMKKRKKTESQPESQAAEVREIAGYVVVPVQLNAYPQGKRYVFYKEHINKGDENDAKETPNGYTLIITNISVDLTEETLRNIFDRFGKIKSVVFKRLLGPQEDSKPDEEAPAKTTGQRGIFVHLVFSSPKSVPKAMKHHWDTVQMITGETQPLGLEKWLESYKGARPDSTSIMAEVDTFMFQFDKEQQKARLAQEESFGKPDKEGFILVQKKGRKRLRDGKANVTAAKVTPELIEKSKKAKVLEDFYRFQRRENMRKQLADLRIRFEEDKKRIAKMRAQRRFRPG